MRRRAALTLVAALLVALPAAGASGGARTVRVLFVTDLLNPASKRDLRGIAYLGFLRAVKDFKIDGRVVQINPYQDATKKLASFARQKYDLIFTGTLAPDSVDPVALKFPQTKFLYPFPIGFLQHKPKNVQGIDFHDWEGSYLAGYLSALMEKRRPGKDVVSSVGGFSFDPVDHLIAGYRAGARNADPGITTLNGYANDFLDPAKCKAVALQQIAAGSGVVFDVAGACGLGALEAAKERGVWGVGVDVDQSFLGPHILTSEVSQLDVAVYSGIRALAHGTFRTGGNTVWDLRNGGVGLGKISPKVPRRFVAQVEKIRAQIVAGKVKIPTRIK
jgi:basic membrane protein A